MSEQELGRLLQHLIHDAIISHSTEFPLIDNVDCDADADHSFVFGTAGNLKFNVTIHTGPR